jgi:Family of unknown function (DUF6496)
MAAKKKSARKYSSKASKSVEREMHEFKRGKLKSGRSGKKVTNPKQAIAIGLSEARQEGVKVPPPPGRKKSAKKKSAGRKSSAKKTSGRRSSAKTSSARKSSGRKTSAKKSSGRRSSAKKKSSS